MGEEGKTIEAREGGREGSMSGWKAVPVCYGGNNILKVSEYIRPVR